MTTLETVRFQCPERIDFRGRCHISSSRSS